MILKGDHIDDGDTIYTFTGIPIAYISDDSIYSFSGRYIGYFNGGIIRDRYGDSLLFTDGASGGPMKLMKPMKSMKKMKPMKGMNEAYAPNENSFLVFIFTRRDI